jgi:fermentation-respiration switch protein FrsA (DUF1100 family)
VAGTRRRVERSLAALGLTLLSLTAVACMDLRSIEHSFIYFPSAPLSGTPASVGLAFEEVWIGPAPRLHAWFVPGDGPFTLLWLHGNGGNISSRLAWLRLLRSALPWHVLLVDYQGYGRSEGRPSEQNTYRDARVALTYLQAREAVDPARLVYYGESLGGAVAAHLASEAPPACLVLQSTFTSLLELARLHYPFLPVGTFLRSRYATLETIGQIAAPVFVAHGGQDEIVPVEQARRLYAAASEPKQLYLVEQASHNDFIDLAGPAYFQALGEFCGADRVPHPA